MSFVLTSPSFETGQVLPQAQVYKGMGQTGENLSPELHWHGAPEGTQSYVVTLYDPDAPTGSGWWHWVACEDLPGAEALWDSKKKRRQPGCVQATLV